MFNKNKKEIPDKNRINQLFVKKIEISTELYEDEERYLNSNS